LNERNRRTKSNREVPELVRGTRRPRENDMGKMPRENHQGVERMTICRKIRVGINDEPIDCKTKMVFSLERRTWYCPECGNQVRVPREQQSLNEYTRKS